MEELKFTPGPWHEHREGFSTVYVEARLRDGVIQEVAACGPTEAGSEQQAANARLIAAAPELLEALQGYMAAVDGMNQAMNDGINIHGAMSALVGYECMAHAAIAKALGK